MAPEVMRKELPTQGGEKSPGKHSTQRWEHASEVARGYYRTYPAHLGTWVPPSALQNTHMHVHTVCLSVSVCLRETGEIECSRSSRNMVGTQ